MNLGIAVPARDLVHTGFTRSLCNLTNRLTRLSIDFDIHFVMSSVICEARTQLTKLCLENNHTHTLWLDSDMHFPSTIFENLISHKKEIVAATYSTRYAPYRNVAFTDKENMNTRLEATQGLHKVWAVGMGCMLVDNEVYKQIPKPWYSHYYNKLEDSFSGEDIYFCDNCYNHGIDVYVDASASQKLSHFGLSSRMLKDVQ
jgi:choline kinase